MNGLERIVERLRRTEVKAHSLPVGRPKQELLDDCRNMRLLVELASVAVQVVADEAADVSTCSDKACSICRLAIAVDKVQREGE